MFLAAKQQSCSRWSVLNKIRNEFSLKCEKQMGRAVGEATRSYFMHKSANYTDDRSRGEGATKNNSTLPYITGKPDKYGARQ